MTSRQYTERTEEADNFPRVSARRGVKTRGILPSFGDIVLPVVGVAAVGLLVLAGRQFFLNGLNSSPSITSTKAYADSPAIIAEREKDNEIMLPPVSSTKALSQEITEAEAKPEDDNSLAFAVPEVKEAPKAQTVKKSSVPAKTSQPAQKKPAPVKAQTPKASQKVPASKQWRIQVGAYTSKAAAQEAAKKINKAGYKAEVYKNPASKHVKVWVQGGTDKTSAQRVVNAMKKMGFKGSFSFPPAK